MTHLPKLGLMAPLMAALMIAPAANAGDKHGARTAHIMTLDLDGDGWITRAEAEKAAAARLDKADTDGNGTLSLPEMQARAQADAAERSARKFARLGANGDGQIGKDEMQGAKRAGRVDRMFDRIDANGDGVLDAGELASARAKHGKRHGGAGAKDASE